MFDVSCLSVFCSFLNGADNFLQGAKGKGKRPAKTSKPDDEEPKTKKAKKDSSESEDSNDAGEEEEEIDFACAATNK